MVKLRIGTRIIISYFLLLVIVFIGMTVSFRFLSRAYLVREARDGMKEEGKVIADILKNAPLEETGIKENLLNRRELRIAGRIMESKIVILNKDKRLVYTNIDQLERQQLAKLIQGNESTLAGYVMAREAIVNNQGGIKGYILLLTKIQDLERLNNLMKLTQRISFFISAVLALIIGAYFQRRLTRPLNQLMDRMGAVAFNNKRSKGVNIKTGDEFEDLSDSFNTMLKRLHSYEETQKRFLQNCSHELKTPLMSIQGYAEAIKDGVVEGRDIEDSLNIIISESQRLKTTVDEIIYLTKIEDGKDSYNFTEVNLASIINEVIRTVKPLADERCVELKNEAGINLLGKFDFEKLKRALINVVGNALRYADKKVRIYGEMRPKEIYLEIIDDGPGFKPGEEKRIFERFYKGDKGGTGLGLAITKAIIEEHQGLIQASNGKDKGAIIKITLPVIPGRFS